MSQELPPPAGRTPATVVSQLVYRVFGPLHRDRVALVLDYHGLAGDPAGTLNALAARRGVTARTVSLHVARVRAAATGLALTADVVDQASRPSLPGEDHTARVRVAATLHLPAPGPAARPLMAGHVLGSGDRAAAVTAGRLLAAAGALPLDMLVAAVARSRRFRRTPPSSPQGLAAALTALRLAALGPAGRWQASRGTRAPARYRAIVTAAAGRDLTRRDMIEVLIGAGYSPASAGGRLSSCHPMFERVGPDRYRVIGTR